MERMSIEEKQRRAYEKAKAAGRIYTEMPEGWKFFPLGDNSVGRYIFNGKSRFSGEYQYGYLICGGNQ